MKLVVCLIRVIPITAVELLSYFCKELKGDDGRGYTEEDKMTCPHRHQATVLLTVEKAVDHLYVFF